MSPRWMGLLALVLIAACSQSASTPEESAEAAALAWLESVDGGHYRASWEQGAALFQKSLTANSWEQSLQAARGSLGPVQSRSLQSAQYTTTLPGAPEGEYVVLIFNTSFANKANAVETVTPMLDGGQWKVSGYYVR